MAIEARRQFAAVHPWDRTFFAVFLLACLAGVAMGFFPASSARMMGRADYTAPLILHIHALAFLGWLALLAVQIVLIRRSRADLHRKLGIVGVILIPVMAYSGFAAELYSQRFYIQRNDDGLDFFILPLSYTVLFAAFAATALWFARRDPPTHKRVLLMATTVIVGAAYARWWGAALTEAFRDGYWGMIVNSFAGTNLILAAAVGYDIATRGHPHRAFAVGVPVILAAQLVISWIYHAAWWPPIARQIIEWQLPLSG